MKNILYISVLMAVLTGCISNDLPYPVVVPNITSMTADGAENVVIDYNKKVVTLHYPETYDVRAVSITSVEFDQAVTVPSIEIVGTHDLSRPLKLKLKTYENEYEWRVVAERNIERYFTVAGQVGSSVIDPVNCRAVVNVSKDVYITNIDVLSLKLGPKDISTYSLELSQMKDFTDGLTVEVTAFGLTEVWTLYVEITESSVELSDVNPWTREVYITASGIAGAANGFRYRVKGAEQWIEVPESDVTTDGGTFRAHLTGLQPETAYEVLAYCGEEKTEVMEFTTDSATQMPNSSFEYASKITGKDYYKFYDPSCGVAEGASMFWGSGNGEGAEGVNGSANLGIVITYVDTQEKVDGNQSVRAETSQMMGMLAAGNIFTGQFAGLVGTSGGMVNFGRPWTTRPRAVKVWCRYQTGKMDVINGFPQGVTHTTEDYDRAEIKIALGTWEKRAYGGTDDSPILINTTDASTFVDFNTDAATIANGGVVIYNDGYMLNGAAKVAEPTDKWIEYMIPLNYRDMDTTPTHIVVSCASSQYGDYFSGCSRSKLWVDAFQLIY